LKVKPHNTYNTNQTRNYIGRYYSDTVATAVTLGVSQFQFIYHSDHILDIGLV
jgi:hypothetical protein